MISEQILSNKGQPLYCLDGYIHRKKRVYNETVYWVCVENHFRAKNTTINGAVVSGPKDHHHEPSSGQIISRLQRNKVKKGVSDNASRKCREIYDSVIWFMNFHSMKIWLEQISKPSKVSRQQCIEWREPDILPCRQHFQVSQSLWSLKLPKKGKNFSPMITTIQPTEWLSLQPQSFFIIYAERRECMLMELSDVFLAYSTPCIHSM